MRPTAKDSKLSPASPFLGRSRGKGRYQRKQAGPVCPSLAGLYPITCGCVFPLIFSRFDNLLRQSLMASYPYVVRE